MKRTSSTASLLSTKRILFFRVRRQPRQDSKKDEWTIPMDNLPLTKHCSESLCRMPSCLVEIGIWWFSTVFVDLIWWYSLNTKHLRLPRRFERGLCNERVPAMKAWLLPSCDEMVDGFVLAMKGWLQWNRGCSRIVDESADGFILMDGTSHALLTRRGHLCFYCQDEARFFCEVGSAMLFF